MLSLDQGVDVGLLLLILVAIAIGFWLGRRVPPADDVHCKVLQPHYIKGLNYLLNEQPDEAIDTFIDALDVNPDTLETHLALGSLLRKRGEVGRAVKIHQNLLARPGLPNYQAQQVQLELARDYVKSGLLDRAELLLQELVPVAAMDIRVASLKHLIEIYRDEKEWLRGIAALNQLSGRLFGRLSDEWRVTQGHFYCEIASQDIAREDHLAARRHLRAALQADKLSVRANLLLGELELQQGNPRDALKALRQIPQQTPDFTSQALPLLITCYNQLGWQSELKPYLQELQLSYDGASLVSALADLIAQQDGEAAALDYLVSRLNARPSLVGLSHLLKYKARQEQGSAHDSLQLTLTLLEKLNRVRPGYRCGRCGFAGNQLHWLCPTCKSWGSIKPVRGVEGE